MRRLVALALFVVLAGTASIAVQSCAQKPGKQPASPSGGPSSDPSPDDTLTPGVPPPVT